MQISDPNFIQIKTKRSPTSNALAAITQEKLKPYYNTVYQLLNIKNPRSDSYKRVSTEIDEKIRKQIPKIILSRRIGQQTLQFKIEKLLEKKHFSHETKSSRLKKCKSVAKSYSLSKQQFELHKRKDNFGFRFDLLRKVSKNVSQSTIPNKKRYNILQKCNKFVENHFENLQLEPKFITEDNQTNKINSNKKQQFRYKLEANKWLENALFSNEQETESLIHSEKCKYLRNKASVLNSYRGVNEKQLQQCKDIIEQDRQLMGFSLSHTISTTKPSEVRSMHQFTKYRLSNLLKQYKTSRKLSHKRQQSSLHRSLTRSQGHNDRNIKNTEQCSYFPLQQAQLRKPSKTIHEQSSYTEYKKFKNNLNENPQKFQAGDRYSNFRSKEQKKSCLQKMKQHQKLKYTTKVMNVNRHRKLFLKQK